MPVMTTEKQLFYTKLTSGRLFSRAATGGQERELPVFVYNKAFLPVAGGIYYIGRLKDEGSYPLEFFDLTTGRSRLLRRIDGPIYRAVRLAGPEVDSVQQKHQRQGRSDDDRELPVDLLLP